MLKKINNIFRLKGIFVFSHLQFDGVRAQTDGSAMEDTKKLEWWRWRPLNFSRDTQGITIFFNSTQRIPPKDGGCSRVILLVQQRSGGLLSYFVFCFFLDFQICSQIPCKKGANKIRFYFLNFLLLFRSSIYSRLVLVAVYTTWSIQIYFFLCNY